MVEPAGLKSSDSSSMKWKVVMVVAAKGQHRIPEDKVELCSWLIGNSPEQGPDAEPGERSRHRSRISPNGVVDSDKDDEMIASTCIPAVLAEPSTVGPLVQNRPIFLPVNRAEPCVECWLRRGECIPVHKTGVSRCKWCYDNHISCSFSRRLRVTLKGDMFFFETLDTDRSDEEVRIQKKRLRSQGGSKSKKARVNIQGDVISTNPPAPIPPQVPPPVEQTLDSDHGGNSTIRSLRQTTRRQSQLQKSLGVDDVDGSAVDDLPINSNPQSPGGSEGPSPSMVCVNMPEDVTVVSGRVPSITPSPDPPPAAQRNLDQVRANDSTSERLDKISEFESSTMQVDDEPNVVHEATQLASSINEPSQAKEAAGREAGIEEEMEDISLHTAPEDSLMDRAAATDETTGPSRFTNPGAICG